MITQCTYAVRTVALIAAIVAGVSGASLAQTDPAEQDTEQLESLVETLEDDGRRAEFLDGDERPHDVRSRHPLRQLRDLEEARQS